MSWRGKFEYNCSTFGSALKAGSMLVTLKPQMGSGDGGRHSAERVPLVQKHFCAVWTKVT